jgi:hypothetical protein
LFFSSASVPQCQKERTSSVFIISYTQSIQAALTIGFLSLMKVIYKKQEVRFFSTFRLKNLYVIADYTLRNKKEYSVAELKKDTRRNISCKSTIKGSVQRDGSG